MFWFFVFFQRLTHATYEVDVANCTKDQVVERCESLFKNPRNAVVATSSDGIHHWGIRNLSALCALCERTSIVSVMSISNSEIDKLVPSIG